MSELELLKKVEKLEEEIRELKGLTKKKIPIFTFSQIKDIDLESVVNIEQNFDNSIFDEWLNCDIKMKKRDIVFLEKLLIKNQNLIKHYNEEDLKIHFLTPIFHKVDFQSYKNGFRDFYNEVLTYETDKFIFTGNTDFVVSKGFKYAKKPYFFIQEFKKTKETSDPEPQLLAELISAVELNNWNEIKGAYIVGSAWNFVILKKIGKDKYQYFISKAFDSTKIDDLKGIYKNLQFVKNEIIEMVRNEKENTKNPE